MLTVVAAAASNKADVESGAVVEYWEYLIIDLRIRVAIVT